MPDNENELVTDDKIEIEDSESKLGVFRERSRIAKEKAQERTHDFVEDFKSFAFKGNVIDLAVGVIIGAAFNNIVNSLVKDIMQPIIGKLVGNTSFDGLYINLSGQSFPNLAAADAAGAPVIRYGLFLTNVINFLITALTIYLLLKFFLRKKKEDQAEKKE